MRRALLPLLVAGAVSLVLAAAAAARTAGAAQRSAVAVAAGLPLKAVARVALPGASVRFDYASIDPGPNRLYIAHMNASELLVFDLRTRRVLQTIAAPGVHGVLAVPQLGRVFASATNAHELLTLDAKTGRVLNRAPAGDYPDGIAYDPVEKRVYVSDESGGIEAVFDQKGERIATIELGGDAGNVQYDAGSKHMLVAVQSRNDIAVIDPRTNQVVRRIAVPGCDHPHGLLIDAPRRLAFVACDRNATLLTLDLKRLKVTGRALVGSGPDVLAFDTSLHRLYVAAESGEVAVFAESTHGLTKLGQALLAPRTHTVAVDSNSHLVYFPLESGSAGRPELLIMAPAEAVAATVTAETAQETDVTVTPPAQPGRWTVLGAAVTSGAENRLSFYRAAEYPQALGIVVMSSSSRTIRVVWTSYCEFQSDDEQTLDDQGTVSGVHLVTVYPPTFPGNTLCFVSVYAAASGAAEVIAAIFST